VMIYEVLCYRTLLQGGVTVLLDACCFITCRYGYICFCASCGAGDIVHALSDHEKGVIVANINCIKHYVSLISCYRP
jgi:hypothetical protein